MQFYSQRSLKGDVQFEVSCPACGYSETTRPRYEKQALFRAKLMAREHGQITDHEVRIARCVGTDTDRGGDDD